ncbi:putative chitin binding domain protein [Operophtera brumata]|uniref:Putative chitin binding domain protein n=1 Tax=Operophtera brumata TaxID=104452 RepID=A0A0L7LH94_OPEBR|nr:putative chitin binding domain protein [Operophtera brumata]
MSLVSLYPIHEWERLLMLGSARRGAEGHGRLMDPPARNSMWRFGFPNPNEGKCGVCGDAHHVSEPRPHEAGGMYGKGIVTRHYSVGQEIEVEVELTANHLGTFKEIFRYRVRLPPYITCTQCVLQWTYYTGNMWGICSNGTEAVGCGRSETFRNCADVSVITSTGGLPPAFAGDFRMDYPFLIFYRDLDMPRNVFPLVVRDQVCVPTPTYRKLPGMQNWCQTNCLRYPPHCPEALCTCPQVCESIGELEGREGADVYCMDQCIVYPPRCPNNRFLCG